MPTSCASLACQAPGETNKLGQVHVWYYQPNIWSASGWRQEHTPTQTAGLGAADGRRTHCACAGVRTTISEILSLVGSRSKLKGWGRGFARVGRDGPVQAPTLQAEVRGICLEISRPRDSDTRVYDVMTTEVTHIHVTKYGNLQAGTLHSGELTLPSIRAQIDLTVGTSQACLVSARATYM
ncbi:hypothetical protein Bbelb_322020 [Branchiostoma belcheri]|nr:hypothetical protein Bbelb_322020 [Branchiostoma belcheri]